MATSDTSLSRTLGHWSLICTLLLRKNNSIRSTSNTFPKLDQRRHWTGQHHYLLALYLQGALHLREGAKSSEKGEGLEFCSVQQVQTSSHSRHSSHLLLLLLPLQLRPAGDPHLHPGDGPVGLVAPARGGEDGLHHDGGGGPGGAGLQHDRQVLRDQNPKTVPCPQVLCPGE